MRPLRVGWVVRLLAAVFAAYLRLVYATIRWEREGQEKAEGVWKAGGGAILCFWHARIPLAPQSWPNEAGRRQEIRALISLSADGEFIARAVAHIGFPSIRGSSKKHRDEVKDKGGAQALRDMLRWVTSGGAVAITPDGPRGPAEVMQKGAPVLAQMSDAPVMLVGLASRPCIRLGTWDRTVVPLPFSKGAMVWDGPLTAERGGDAERLAAEWADRLSAATRRAEEMLGGAD
ncbi:MAG TPA: lysophospholipid acyltransferase family protein [Caulobacteraceae bacterium]